jgi:hypothetical protein
MTRKLAGRERGSGLPMARGHLFTLKAEKGPQVKSCTSSFDPTRSHTSVLAERASVEAIGSELCAHNVNWPCAHVLAVQ